LAIREGIVVAVCIGLALLFFIRYLLFADTNRRYQATGGIRAWRAAYEAWEKSYYCGRCDNIFMPEVPADLIDASVEQRGNDTMKLEDAISLITRDGTRVDRIHAHVSNTTLTTSDAEHLIEDGDTVIHQLPDGTVDHLLVLDSHYHGPWAGKTALSR
jgi:hypothetical protein